MTAMNLQQIDAGIKKLPKMAAEVDQFVQELAVAILVHAKDHGDTTRALALVNALPRSYRREMLVNWFAYFGPVGIDVRGGKTKMIQKTSNRYREFNIDAARANPWFNPESVPANNRPEPVSNTLLEFQNNIVNFADRLERQLNETFPDSDKPRFALNDEQRATALAEIDAIRRIGQKYAASAEADRLTNEVIPALNEQAKVKISA